VTRRSGRYVPSVDETGASDELHGTPRSVSPKRGSKRWRSTRWGGRRLTAIRQTEASGSWITRTARYTEAAHLAYGVSRT